MAVTKGLMWINDVGSVVAKYPQNGQREGIMYFLALAVDFDGTLAQDGVVLPETLDALRGLMRSGRRLVLVTGRRLDDLKNLVPELDLFERVVLENGAVLYEPKNDRERILAPAPSDALVQRLAERGIAPLEIGKAVVATWHPHERAVLAAITELGLELQIIFNKGAIMILPTSVNKASGLRAALDELDISPLNVVGIGDAENDHSFLRICGCSAAVGNALPAIKQAVDVVAVHDHGAGVIEMVRRIESEDLGLISERKRGIPAGGDFRHGTQYLLPEDLVLIVGNSGCGKSSYATRLTEEMAARQHEFCVIDPEGDYIGLDNAETIGGTKDPPATQEALRLLISAGVNVVVNTQALDLSERQRLFGVLLTAVAELRRTTGRPHWLLIDEAHHVMPALQKDRCDGPLVGSGAILLSLEPTALPLSVLRNITVFISMGTTAAAMVSDFARIIGVRPPSALPQPAADEKLIWHPTLDEKVIRLMTRPPSQRHNRHAGKYATGDVGDWHSFYFRGPRHAANHRAGNLKEFVTLSRTLDDETWDHHLLTGDYARWFQHVIKDDVLTQRALSAQADWAADSTSHRRALIEAINSRYKL
ncbi:HAD-IIB family hydrolase [Rhizobium sp. P32RR-XVIII]|uniref:HAD-IIB family hydrolase n=1 Tax=Rhizobium sp. P32RR-XVIII TaxID=2726738 RepID=UPI001456D96D|nr:HAD-IIB family hydrolase [Rhizobium sp. P32RR-XVIII]NLS08239.1 HAD-IIB family hydrolase [Rhizobium sp. P32RR-XVIII]